MVGIYKIYSIIDGKIYIGQSINIKSRLQDHFKLLKKNKHENRHLQFAFNLYGINNFSSSIVEICTIDELPKREFHHIDKLKSNDEKFGYNFYTKESGFVKHSAKSIELMRSIKTGKKVYGFDKQGNLIKEWDSIKMCAKELNANPCDVRRTIHQEQITCKGYVLNNERVFRSREAKTKYNYLNFRT